MLNDHPSVTSPQASESCLQDAKPSLAVIGGGLAGLSAAWLLKDKYDVTLFESHDRVGMGVFTADYHSNGISTRIDIPLRIFTKGYYPQLFALYDHLNIEMEDSNHASVFQTFTSQSVTPFFQYNNIKLLNKPFRYLSKKSVNVASIKLIFAHAAFFKQAKQDVAASADLLKNMTFEQYINKQDFNQHFINNMLLPALSVTCTCDYQGILNYPADVILGYLTCGVMDEGIVRAKLGVDGIVPKITQGFNIRCSEKVESLVLSDEQKNAPILLTSKNPLTGDVKPFHFNHVVVATQANIAAEILAASVVEGSLQSQQSQLLNQIPMQSSSMTLHTDSSVVYHSEKAAPVSYVVNGMESSTSVDLTKAFSTYRLQQPVYQTWNANTPINIDSIISQQYFTRPLVTLDSRSAVVRLKQINCHSPIKIVGSYMANKIPLLDAAVESSVGVAQVLGCDIPWLSDKQAVIA